MPRARTQNSESKNSEALSNSYQSSVNSHSTITNYSHRHLIQAPSNPLPVIDGVSLNDHETFPKTIKFLFERKEKIAQIKKSLKKSLPEYNKNLKKLADQFSEHNLDFTKLSAKFDTTTKELSETKKITKILEAKNTTLQKEISELEKVNQEYDLANQDKEKFICDLQDQVGHQKYELDQRLSLAEKRLNEVTAKAVRDATFEKNEKLKQREAKLAQLKHVLAKSGCDTDEGISSNCRIAPMASLGPNVNTRGRSQRPVVQKKVQALQNSSPKKSKPRPAQRKKVTATAAPENDLQNAPSIAKSRNIQEMGAPLRRSRSKSQENLKDKSLVLAHTAKADRSFGPPADSILRPKILPAKTIHTNPSNKDLQKHSKYVLTAESYDTDGERQTQYLKGDIIKTKKMNKKSEHGVSVQFTEMEILKSVDPVVKAMRPNNENSFVRNSPQKSPSKFECMIQNVRRNLSNISDAVSQGSEITF